MDSSYPGDDDLAALFRIKGLSQRRRFVRVEKDPETGLDANVYELDDSDEWPTCYPVDERGRKI